MKFPLSWLKEFIAPLPSNEKLAEILTNLGLEVDAIHAFGDDWIFEISLTPNMYHAASLLGIARELKAELELSLHLPSLSLKEEKGVRTKDKVSLSVIEPALCPRYCARLVSEVKVGPSPLWLSKRLEAMGLRSINNVVDVTNLVMMELGHPLHAFDFDKVMGGKIVVRRAENGEKIETIDHVVRHLTDDILVIADEKRPLAIAGVIGGAESEVVEGTTTVLLESAFFDPASVRRCAKKLDIATEASRRFERTVDIEAIPMALDRAAMLLQMIASGKVLSEQIEVRSGRIAPPKATLRVSRVNALLGLNLSISEVENLLKRLSFKVRLHAPETLEVEIPSFRPDVKEEIDLVEEVARLYGYDHIYEQRRLVPIHSSNVGDNPAFLFEREVKAALLSQGLTELLCLDLVQERLAKRVMKDGMPPRSIIKVMNPHSVEASCLRPSLLPNHITIVKHNFDHSVESIAAFEIGRIHFKEKENYLEPMAIGITLSGKRSPYYFDPKPLDFDFFDLKGILENLFADLKIQNVTFVPSHHSSFHPHRQAKLMIDEREIGLMGELNPLLCQEEGIDKRVFFAEVSFDELARVRKPDVKMVPLSQFPSSWRDWTLHLKEELEFSELQRAILAMDSKLLEKNILVDIFKGVRVGAGYKNVTVRFVYRDNKETISQSQVDAEQKRLQEGVSEKLKSYFSEEAK